MNEFRFAMPHPNLLVSAAIGTIGLPEGQKLWDFQDNEMSYENATFTITNFCYTKVPTAEYRKAEAERLKQTRDLIAKNGPGVAMVVSNPVIRMSLSGIFLISPLPMPHKVVSTNEQAADWVIERAAILGIEVPGHAVIVEALEELVRDQKG